jgi:O-antigen ligase
MSPHQMAGPAVATHRAPSVLARLLTVILLALLGLLLIEVLFEGWVQIRFGTRTHNPQGGVAVDLLAWPKTLKNGLYLTLAAVAAMKITVDRRWRDFRTGADVALLGLVAVMLVAGIVGDSSATLIGKSLFVYFRGVVAFYAWRALAPTWPQIRLILVIIGGVIALNVAIAWVEIAGGQPVYQALGWVDLTWARTNRAHALLTHPNHFGHLLSLTILGITSWMVTRRRPDRRWWLVLGGLAVGLAASQSRESVVALIVAIILIWALARSQGRRILLIVLIVAASSTAIVLARPSNWAEWQRRLAGVVDAFRVPSGTERTPAPRPTAGPTATDPTATDPTATPQAAPTRSVPAREIRVLYYQQGLRLWTREPLLGYGLGQFGGIVAQENDPNWHLHPQFGPGGFNRHGFKSVQVDSFWLHLLVETGALGLLAYLAWLFFLVRPLLRRTPRFGKHKPYPPEAPPPEALDARDRAQAFCYWAIAAIAFAIQVAFLSASLEDPLLPALLFTVVGIAWVTKKDMNIHDNETHDTLGRDPGSGAPGPHANLGAS